MLTPKERETLESALEALSMASAYFDSLAVTKMLEGMEAMPSLSSIGVRMDAEVQALAELLGVGN